MDLFKNNYIMQKKGQLEIFPIVAFIVVTGSLIAGTFLIADESHSMTSTYIGDISTLKYYNYECISNIDVNNRVYFKSSEAAENLSFIFSEC